MNKESYEKQLARQRNWKRKQRLNPEYRAKQSERNKIWYYKKVSTPEGRRELRERSRIKCRVWMWKQTLKKFDLTVEDYYSMLSKQGGGCEICSKPPNGRTRFKLCIDHNHLTGKVRGLLCVGCNVMIGWIENDSNRFKKAILYLGYE